MFRKINEFREYKIKAEFDRMQNEIDNQRLLIE